MLCDGELLSILEPGDRQNLRALGTLEWFFAVIQSGSLFSQTVKPFKGESSGPERQKTWDF